MEVQVNVAQGDGEPAFGTDLKPKPNTYINDEHEEWYNYRIPKNAKGDPTDNSEWEQNVRSAQALSLNRHHGLELQAEAVHRRGLRLRCD